MEIVNTIKYEWYDLKKYRSEIASFIQSKRKDLDMSSIMNTKYNQLYKAVHAGTETEEVQRFPHAAEVYKTYKTAIVSSCLGGYSALGCFDADDGNSVLAIPQIKNALVKQFKRGALIENLTFHLDDFILKGEQIAFLKYKTNRELYRTRETVTDVTTGEPVMSFKMIKGLERSSIDVELIDPLDFFVDALDYMKDPRGCVKIIRSYTNAKNILTSNEYPLLTKDEKDLIITHSAKNGGDRFSFFNWGGSTTTQNITNQGNIEVLTFIGDYITSDNKVLSNITAVSVGGFLASVQYNQINTNRVIYAPYSIDKDTHRGFSPICGSLPVNKLINRATDMLLLGLENSSVPWILYPTGSINAQTDIKSVRKKRELEYVDGLGEKPSFWIPPFNGQMAIPFLDLILQQSKNILGLNNYTTGDTSGAVRTARETAVLTQNINARQRIETDPYSYNFLLPLLNAYYALNRELACVYHKPLDPVFTDESIDIDISTNVSRADKEGEFNRLMQLLQLPIAQMMFSNFTPEQTSIAIRYLMSKAEIEDVDNILELKDQLGGNTQPPIQEEMPMQQSIPPVGQ